jgi:predicted membrane GTPase involved in stress response
MRKGTAYPARCDAAYFDITYRIAVEGVLTVSGTSNSASRWVEGTKMVTVSDGRITLRSATGATANKICFVEITPQSVRMRKRTLLQSFRK